MASKKKTKKKAVSFRQRLRTQAQSKLEKILDDADNAIMESVKSNGTAIHRGEIMRLLSGGQTKTLRDQVITELANETEKQLEEIYNTQLGLLPGDDNAEG